MFAVRRAALLLSIPGAVAACQGFKDNGAPAGADAGSDTGSDGGTATDAGPEGDTGPAGDEPAPPDCDGSTCGIETVFSGLLQGGTIAVDDTNVYVEDQGTTTGKVYQCPKTGCSTPTLLGPGYATGIASDSQFVYWNDFSGGTIVRCAIGGCANSPTVIVPNQPHAEGLSFDGANLFWAATGSILTCASPACAMPSVLATGQGSTITGTTAETAIVYWISGGAVRGCPAGGCGQKPATVTSSLTSGPYGNDVVVKDGFAYFTSGNSVVSCPVTSTCAFPLTIGASSAPFGLASDGSDVYWLDVDIAKVYRCPVTGCVGSAEVFADQSSFDPAGEFGASVALDGEYAYWADPVSVYRKHK
jgi:hypothetical protein